MASAVILKQMLEKVATALGEDLLEKLVFVGGCTTALFITDPVTLQDVRATDDVDLIVKLIGFSEWAKLQEQLGRREFTSSPEDDFTCRLRLDGLKVDFMPDDPKILGFSNRWYEQGIETAQNEALNDQQIIKRLSPQLFVATKFEAYIGRGEGVILTSSDMEDILLLVDGRAALPDEVHSAENEVRQFIATEVEKLTAHKDFDHFINGNIAGPEGRVEIVLDRLKRLSGL